MHAHSRMYTRKKKYEKYFFQRAYRLKSIQSNDLNRFNRMTQIDRLMMIERTLALWRFESITRYVRDRRIRFFSQNLAQNVLLTKSPDCKVSCKKSLAKIPPRVKSFYVVRLGGGWTCWVTHVVNSAIIIENSFAAL